MKFVALVAAIAAVVPAALGLTINTPSNIVQCEPIQFSWSGGTSPYYLTLVPAAQIAAPAIKQFPTQSGTSYTWNVDLGTGTSFTIALKDSTGATAYSDIVTVTSGTDSTCLNSNVTETGGTSGSGGGGSSPSSTGSSPSGSSPSGSTHSGSSSTPTSTASGKSSTSSSAADRLGAPFAFGVAGVLGLVSAALF